MALGHEAHGGATYASFKSCYLHDIDAFLEERDAQEQHDGVQQVAQGKGNAGCPDAIAASLDPHCLGPALSSREM